MLRQASERNALKSNIAAGKNFIASAKNSIRCAQLEKEEKSSHVVAHLCLQRILHGIFSSSKEGCEKGRDSKGSSLGESKRK